MLGRATTDCVAAHVQVMVPIVTREYLNIDRMNGWGEYKGQKDWCYEELKQAMEQEHTTVIPFVVVGFHESMLPPAERCFSWVSHCPPPVNKLFENDMVSDSDDYFGGCLEKLTREILSVLDVDEKYAYGDEARC